MRFIGGKERMLKFIEEIINEKNISGEVLADCFSGTTIVAQYFKKKNYSIISNDTLFFSYLIQRTYIENNQLPQFKKLNNLITNIYHNLNQIKGFQGYCFENFAPSGKFKRMFFTDDNAMKIDGILKQICDWKTKMRINEDEEVMLMTSLIEAVPFISNISGTYGAFLKTFDKRAFKSLELKIPEIYDNRKINLCYNMDSNELVKNIESDICYFDPPYNNREYISNYHLLETLAKNDNNELRGKSGLRSDDINYKSKYCKKDLCTGALADLISNTKSKFIMLSYNSEGIIKNTDIEKIFKINGSEYFKKEFEFSRFKSNSNGIQKRLIKEYIYTVKIPVSKIYLINQSKIINEKMLKKEKIENQGNLFSNGSEKISVSNSIDIGERGLIDKRNSLNDLTGREWIYRTNSVEIIDYSEEDLNLLNNLKEVEVTKFSTKGIEGYSHKLRSKHPSPKPPQLLRKLIEFFTKENEIILDPFMGVGATLLGASMINRKAVGIDLSPEYIKIYKQVCTIENLPLQTTIVANSKKINELNKIKQLKFDLVLTDPPYGNMMNKKKTGETTKKGKDNKPTPFTNDKEDIGNSDLVTFLEELKLIIEKSIINLRPKRYVLIFTKDFQPKSEYHGMLHADTVKKLLEIENLSYKGMKIWYDKTVNLFPYGYPYSYVGNQLHQYILIFRKEY